jgi:hypothetical protein
MHNVSPCVRLQGFTFYLSIFNNVFAVCGLFGVVNAQRELIIAFFGYNAAQVRCEVLTLTHCGFGVQSSTGCEYAKLGHGWLC